MPILFLIRLAFSLAANVAIGGRENADARRRCGLIALSSRSVSFRFANNGTEMRVSGLSSATVSARCAGTLLEGLILSG